MQTATVAKQNQVDVLQSNAFTIQSSGKMFHMVMAGLYSDKPQSITREIWSNAFDAHAMCGKADVPFDVTFPTNFMPEFACRDYGEGISHADMQSLYTILGHSSKENTNQAVGKWGVGRMSPMSYTDSFTVTSIHKGMKAIYNVMLDDDGGPKLHTFMEPTPSTEPSGVRISFPVDRKDVDTFQKAARRVSLGFDVKPIVTNKTGFVQWPAIVKMFEGSGFYTYESFNLDPNKYGHNFAGTFVKMGCVLYPIDDSIISTAKNLGNIILEVPIGSLGVSASRESLSYGRNEPTINTLETAISKMRDEVAGLVEKKLSTAKSYFHAYCMAQEITRNVPRVGARLTWKGKTLDKAYGYYLSVNGRTNVNLRRVDGHIIRGIFETTDSWRISINGPYAFVTLDVTKKKPIRFPARLEAMTSNVFVIEYDSTKPASVADLASFVEEFDGAIPFIDADTLPDPGVKPTGKRGPVKVKSISKGGYITPIDMDEATFQAGGVYVPLVGSVAADDHKGFKGILSVAFEKAGISTLYGVNAVMMKKFEGQPQWVTFKEYMKVFINKNSEEIAFRKKFHGLLSVYTDSMFHKLTGLGSKEIDDLSAAMKKVESFKSGIDPYIWGAIQNFCDLQVTQVSTFDLSHLEEAVDKKFPLLSMLPNSTNPALIRPYIKALA
jgi:hypothetical protein